MQLYSLILIMCPNFLLCVCHLLSLPDAHVFYFLQPVWEPKPSRMLLMQITDGTSVVRGMEYHAIPILSLNIKPGAKVCEVLSLSPFRPRLFSFLVTCTKAVNEARFALA